MDGLSKVRYPVILLARIDKNYSTEVFFTPNDQILFT